MRTFSRLLSLGLLLLAPSTLRADNPVVVHEWGTFTSLQDENGQAIGGINVDDEPVPGFVHGLSYVRALKGQRSDWDGEFGLPPYGISKGWQPEDSQVTMRLETPVLYIYPPKGMAPASLPPLQVHVDFHGGILSQFYPYADTKGFPESFPVHQNINIGDLTTGLTWKNIRLGAAKIPVQTDDKVWTTPREVSAPVLEADAQIYNGAGGFNQSSEAEHFLFYRGIGHLDSPLIVRPNGSGKKGAMEMYSPGTNGILDIPSAWIVDIRPDGSCAALKVEDHMKITETKTGTQFVIKDLHSWMYVSGFNLFTNFSADFTDTDFSTANLAQLKASMQAALVKEGLYPDEASAMLRTWELSYFKSPGLRFFYIVPRAWVDRVLPLKISGAPTDITRVMIGRIELINDEQRAALARLAAGPCPDLAAVKQAAFDALEKGHLTDAQKEPFYSGEKPLTDLGIAIPPLVQDYLSLGRFRDALIVHEQQLHASPALAQFIKNNQLAQAREYTTIPAVDPTASR